MREGISTSVDMTLTGSIWFWEFFFTESQHLEKEKGLLIVKVIVTVTKNNIHFIFHHQSLHFSGFTVLSFKLLTLSCFCKLVVEDHIRKEFTKMLYDRIPHNQINREYHLSCPVSLSQLDSATRSFIGLWLAHREAEHSAAAPSTLLSASVVVDWMWEQRKSTGSSAAFKRWSWTLNRTFKWVFYLNYWTPREKALL